MKKSFALFVILVMALAAPVFAGSYNYVSPEQLKTWIESGTPVMIVDIQVEDEFNAHHIKDSVATHSYPVKSDADREKLSTAVSQAKENTDPVVIVCPRGKGGAKRCYDHMADQGIDEGRLLILEKGMGGWPYKEMVESK